MALWQYEISAYPRENLKKITKTDGNNINDILENTQLWDDFSLSQELEDYLSSILDIWKGWEGMKLYGSTDHNDIQLYKESGIIESLRIRIDLSKFEKPYFQKICHFLSRFNLWVYDYEKIIIDPTPDNLAESIRRSRSFKFLSDPEWFLEDIKNNPIK